jgi:hypothetical protein
VVAIQENARGNLWFQAANLASRRLTPEAGRHRTTETAGMNTERKKSGRAFWATVLILLLVAYPLIYGPWLYVGERWGFNTWFFAATRGAFVPLNLVNDHGPHWLTGPYKHYLSWCTYRGKRDR